MGTNLDILVIENYILLKEEQDSSLKKNTLMCMSWIKSSLVLFIKYYSDISF